MIDLGGGDEQFRDDHGDADPAVTTALSAFAAGTGGEHAALTALAGTRLLARSISRPAAAVLTGQGLMARFPPPGPRPPGRRPVTWPCR
jgi:hypothetical protein